MSFVRPRELMSFVRPRELVSLQSENVFELEGTTIPVQAGRELVFMRKTIFSMIKPEGKILS